ncbi:MAG TPA: GWxTD domain-containing protein [Patescibacteria group bacterium]|nr:GWxTD domain-containing protein [Patescibacteria group bacterium]
MKKENVFSWLGFTGGLSPVHFQPQPQKGRARKALRPGLGIFLLIQLLASCSGSSRAVRTLPPQDRQFLSEVRYLISKKEKKIFMRTQTDERKQFIEEFWKQRDPDPTTPENEFRTEYYRRIDFANHLFRGGDSGWLSDRGRIYILLGEPERRDVFPSGYSFYDPPVEIWYYGFFPIIFVDYEREGLYKLEPSSARRMSMINITQMRLKPPGITRNIRQFDFVLTLQADAPGQAKLLFEVPYRVTNLVQNEQSGALETRIKLKVLVANAAGETVLEKEELHPVSVDRNKLEQLGKTFIIEFALKLPPGQYTAKTTLVNTADGSQVQKELKIKM